MEYFLKEERKEALGTRAEAKGTRRTEDLKEEVSVFMVVCEKETWSTDDISASLLAQMITNQGFISLFGISLKAAFGLPHLVSSLFGPLISGVSETFFLLNLSHGASQLLVWCLSSGSIQVILSHLLISLKMRWLAFYVQRYWFNAELCFPYSLHRCCEKAKAGSTLRTMSRLIYVHRL